MALVYTVTSDYLTTTWPATVETTPLNDAKGMYMWARELGIENGAEYELKRWAWQGYTGWSCGPCSWGERMDGSILRLSNIFADRWLEEGKPTGHNISRFDVAVTVWGCLDIDKAVALHSVEADAYRKTLHSRPFDVRHINGFGKGDTCYIGGRSSEIFLRIYNKEKEQADNEYYQTAIRYEVEFKGPSAVEAMDRYRDGGGTRERLAAIAAGVLQRRGVVPIVDFSSDRAFVGGGSRLRGDNEASLAWLETQVAPTVRRLLAAGLRDRLIEAIGLEQRKRRDQDGTNRD